jgi:D-glycero-D-manno-heptose 1,7-bisphosphate phosphatase
LEAPVSKAVFFDRDGTLINYIPYLHRISEIQFIPRVFPALRLLKEDGFKIFIVTNQAGVAHGLFSEEDVLKVNHYISKQLEQYDCFIDGWYYCPHHPQAKIRNYQMHCNCRKPNPGMLIKASLEHHVDLSRSYIVGDREIDLLAGQSTGSIGLLVLTGLGMNEFRNIHPLPISFISLLSAARWIIHHAGGI